MIEGVSNEACTHRQAARSAARPEAILRESDGLISTGNSPRDHRPRTLARTNSGRETRLPKNRTTLPVYFVLPGWPHL